MENDIEALARDVVLVESPEELPVTKTWRYCFMWGVTWALPLAFIFFIIIPYAFLSGRSAFQTSLSSFKQKQIRLQQLVRVRRGMGVSKYRFQTAL
ncbi:uncharacterized protein LOC135401508 isoform X5 [Ornithodoros turicata]|uniref:uncharacterized protein LOC135401508 isoform X5 n=1 Tax=Ornithodoros turicata TaxID=34597 RepID=UPI003139E299